MGCSTYENRFKMDEIKDIVAILLGKTGVGKSSFINSITNKNECKIGNESKACTTKIHCVDISKNGLNFYFVDTPGLDDGKGDEKNIKKLGDIRKKYPRINVFIICIEFTEIRLTKSMKMALKEFMTIFPCHKFWDHVIILRTKSFQSARFEEYKQNVEGQLVKGINEDEELIDFMNKNKINRPCNLKEYFVDSYPKNLDNYTKDQFQEILNNISNIYPIYKEVKEETKEYVNEEKDSNSNFLHIRTEKIITFKDFDDKEHCVVQTSEETYNLDNIKPIFYDLKREQETTPRGILCWKNQFKTKYYEVKIYDIKGNHKRVECFIEYRWESKDKEDGEIPGEIHRMKILKSIKENEKYV